MVNRIAKTIAWGLIVIVGLPILLISATLEALSTIAWYLVHLLTRAWAKVEGWD